MENILLISFALLGALLLRALWQLVKLSWAPNARLPGPWYTKYTGLVMTYKEFNGTGAHWVEQLHRKYGNVVRIKPNEVDFNSPSASKTIHSYRKPFMKAAFYNMLQFSPEATSLLSTRDSVNHARLRRLFSSSTSESSMKLVEPLVNERVELAIQRMEEEMVVEGYADVMKWWMFMATDVSGHLSFGESFRMLEQKKKNQYAMDLEAASKNVGIMQLAPRLWKYLGECGLPFFRSVLAQRIRIQQYADESLRRQQRMQITEAENFKPTFFTNILREGEKSGDTMSWNEMCMNGALFIIAGADTTAHTLTYLVWQLSKAENISIKKRLLEELSSLKDGFTNEDLKPLPYLQCVISETLRLHAPAPGALPRDVPPGGAEVDGIWLEEGTVAVTQPFCLHRNADVFPEPEKFNPSRWEAPTKAMNDAFLAFGGGSRTCIGIHLANMELRLATVKFFLKFPYSKVSTKEGFCEDDMEMWISYLMSPKKHRCLIELS